MNQYFYKEGGSAVERTKAGLHTPFSRLQTRRIYTLLPIVCALALVFAACDTGTGASTSSDSTSTTTSRALRGITLNHTSLTLITNEGFNQATLTATLIPDNASNKKVTWTSSDETVVKIEATNLEAVITALKVGSSTITVTPADGATPATCVVTVSVPKSITVLDYQEYYDPNDDFVLGDTKLRVVYEDGSVSPVPIPATEAMIRPYLDRDWSYLTTPKDTGAYGDSAKYAASEQHTLRVKYGDVWGTFKVIIRAPKYVTIIGTPKRTVYAVGERFDPEGLTLTVSYDIGPNREGIPLTTDILDTAWHAKIFSATVTTPQPKGATDATVRVLGSRPMQYAEAHSIGPFMYQGLETSATGLNLTTLNGMDAIDNLTVAYNVARITVNGVDTYLAGGTTSGRTASEIGNDFKDLVNTIGAEQTATIRVSTPMKIDIGVPDNRPVVLNSPKNITVEGIADSQVTITQVDNGIAPIFKVSNGASLTLDNKITLVSAANNLMPVVDLNGPKSTFTMKAGSRINIAGAGPLDGGSGVGALLIQSGTATIKSGAVISVPVTVPATATSALTTLPQTYISTAGVFVAPGAKLIMEGGTVTGPRFIHADKVPANTARIGVGDVVVAGTLELGNDATIDRLALAANGPVTEALVKINTGWMPRNGTVMLNLTGNTTELSTVQGFFGNRKLFTGPGVSTTTLSFFDFNEEAGTSTNKMNGGGFFLNGPIADITSTYSATLRYTEGNPVLIQKKAGGAGGYELIVDSDGDGRLVN